MQLELIVGVGDCRPLLFEVAAYDGGGRCGGDEVLLLLQLIFELEATEWPKFRFCSFWVSCEASCPFTMVWPAAELLVGVELLELLAPNRL